MIPCIVCETPTDKLGHMCPACCRSYDKANSKDSTVLGLIEWAANRVRKVQRKKLGKPRVTRDQSHQNHETQVYQRHHLKR